jgi:hypothetical protein
LKEITVKYMIYLSLVILLIAGSVVSVQNTAKPTADTYMTGDRGQFEYPWADGTDKEFVVWRTADNGIKTFRVSGIITAATEVSILNASITKKELFKINGKEVVIIGTFRSEGVGKNQETYCEKLIIIVVPKGK